MFDAQPSSSTIISRRPTTKRGNDTYNKVILAGINCIVEQGLHQASTNKIAKAADVTWGTLQHQFGDKARLLKAILEHYFNQQIQLLAHATANEPNLTAHIDTIVEAI